MACPHVHAAGRIDMARPAPSPLQIAIRSNCSSARCQILYTFPRGCLPFVIISIVSRTILGPSPVQLSLQICKSITNMLYQTSIPSSRISRVRDTCISRLVVFPGLFIQNILVLNGNLVPTSVLFKSFVARSEAAAFQSP